MIDTQQQPKIDRLGQSLATSGVVVLDDELQFLTNEEWNEIETLSLHSGLPYETVLIGDAGEPNKVEVGRLMTDVDRPRVVNPEISEKMMSVLGAPRRMAILQKLIGATGPLHMRRAQINLMHEGSFIGVHLDNDSNPDYEISVVLQLGRAFEGGDFVVHRPDGGKTTISPEFQSVTVSRCDYPHEVRRVDGGVRASLVFFVSDHDGDNRRVRA
ncbi:MAG: 2OG-Fe(II) oxygenase [Alphaproteobacteria bacterium]|jgi:Rps23 Pro-64 3,4-dihydroxylase Tpa1-like proline 4-hydroxylase